MYYPHDAKAFTQGLQFHNGKLYEGTGEPRESRLYELLISKPESQKKNILSRIQPFLVKELPFLKIKFTSLRGKTTKFLFITVNDIMHPIATYNWSLEGWGITNDGNNLIISDGSSKLYYVLPDENTKEMKTMKILTVADNTGELDSLNELEYINGYVFANRWYNNHIYKIDTSNGHAVGIMDFTGLLHQYDPN